MLDTYIDYEARALRYFIERCRELTPEQLHQTFDLGHSSVHATLDHVIFNLEVWTGLMREVPFKRPPSIPEEVDSILERFDVAMAYFTDFARSVESDNRLDDTFVDPSSEEPVPIRFGLTILHVLTHTTMHRWEIQHMLQRLGLADLLDGDVLERTQEDSSDPWWFDTQIKTRS